LAFTRTPAAGFPATYEGTDGIDTLVLLDQPSDIRINGLGENDVITVGAAALAVSAISNFKIYGNDGSDTISITAASLSSSLVQGGSGEDRIVFSAVNSLNSTIRGGAGNDTLFAGNMNQSTANGSNGDDLITVVGNVFSSRVFGGADNDTIQIFGVNSRNSRFNGSKGADRIEVSAGANLTLSSVFGGEGNDLITSTAANTSEGYYSGDLGNDVLTLSHTTAVGTPIVVTALGGDGNDLITVNAGTNEVTYEVTGGTGADQIFLAGVGIDNLTFNRGDSVASTDQLFTGATLAAADTITFANGVDTITGFATTIDDINVDIAVPTVLTNINGFTLNTVLLSTGIFEVSGTLTGNVFAADNSGTDFLYIVGGGGLTVDQALRTSSNIFISDNALAIGDFS
jgi:Ca2+-binding RTX toxin-like protein